MENFEERQFQEFLTLQRLQTLRSLMFPRGRPNRYALMPAFGGEQERARRLRAWCRQTGRTTRYPTDGSPWGNARRHKPASSPVPGATS